MSQPENENPEEDSDFLDFLSELDSKIDSQADAAVTARSMPEEAQAPKVDPCLAITRAYAEDLKSGKIKPQEHLAWKILVN
jgi:hypothetical protein